MATTHVCGVFDGCKLVGLSMVELVGLVGFEVDAILSLKAPRAHSSRPKTKRVPVI